MNADPVNTLCSPLSPDIMYILSCLTDLYTVLKYRVLLNYLIFDKLIFFIFTIDIHQKLDTIISIFET